MEDVVDVLNVICLCDDRTLSYRSRIMKHIYPSMEDTPLQPPA